MDNVNPENNNPAASRPSSYARPRQNNHGINPPQYNAPNAPPAFPGLQTFSHPPPGLTIPQHGQGPFGWVRASRYGYQGIPEFQTSSGPLNPLAPPFQPSQAPEHPAARQSTGLTRPPPSYGTYPGRTEQRAEGDWPRRTFRPLERLPPQSPTQPNLHPPHHDLPSPPLPSTPHLPASPATHPPTPSSPRKRVITITPPGASGAAQPATPGSPTKKTRREEPSSREDEDQEVTVTRLLFPRGRVQGQGQAMGEGKGGSGLGMGAFGGKQWIGAAGKKVERQGRKAGVGRKIEVVVISSDEESTGDERERGEEKGKGREGRASAGLMDGAAISKEATANDNVIPPRPRHQVPKAARSAPADDPPTYGAAPPQQPPVNHPPPPQLQHAQLPHPPPQIPQLPPLHPQLPPLHPQLPPLHPQLPPLHPQLLPPQPAVEPITENGFKTLPLLLRRHPAAKALFAYAKMLHIEDRLLFSYHEVTGSATIRFKTPPTLIIRLPGGVDLVVDLEEQPQEEGEGSVDRAGGEEEEFLWGYTRQQVLEWRKTWEKDKVVGAPVTHTPTWCSSMHGPFPCPFCNDGPWEERINYVRHIGTFHAAYIQPWDASKYFPSECPFDALPMTTRRQWILHARRFHDMEVNQQLRIECPERCGIIVTGTLDTIGRHLDSDSHQQMANRAITLPFKCIHDCCKCMFDNAGGRDKHSQTCRLAPDHPRPRTFVVFAHNNPPRLTLHWAMQETFSGIANMLSGYRGLESVVVVREGEADVVISKEDVDQGVRFWLEDCWTRLEQMGEVVGDEVAGEGESGDEGEGAVSGEEEEDEEEEEDDEE
ncbi:hypothetical protein BJ508DRAFT_307637 [Ascobolus immersus RN42]|uniref:Uncharacterized protein n=1 Tax=Ascobolus immersus RN42 TaxID=1160509 RepID=A0A3N4I2C8_ASCIM|nr:hypothetical protein BJ508DRAFT_307637 [Ascobolus immersus RN42]